MKLTIHNILKCRKSECSSGGYPLDIVSAEEICDIENPDVDKDYLGKMLETRVDWAVLRKAIEQLKWPELPEVYKEELLEDEENCASLWEILLNKEIITGVLK
mmetsp:Transcript_26185/g.26066  ORF Transcript_26185/g.26066 Transcript_26185/m.26066 type:complete len:103 (-) Transcript_26185:57-365(-)|eukprot:CAMPEP_0197008118 /NCGR_PEP_ID=MMETSP1380-20130617/43892_1 /TAXON_ID=5936 /ORGANISM="Euplotes crassus, Strain CT5" /LENGTH=102 /DNA_ID=CAMNT_0042428561 /DNA_START=15 /DNA_END=323 /DNA_ORIENTATION=-